MKVSTKLDNFSLNKILLGNWLLKIMIHFLPHILKKVSELLVESFSEQNFYLVKSCPIWLKLLNIFTRHLIQKIPKFEQNWTTFCLIKFSSEFWQFYFVSHLIWNNNTKYWFWFCSNIQMWSQLIWSPSWTWLILPSNASFACLRKSTHLLPCARLIKLHFWKVDALNWWFLDPYLITILIRILGE